MRVAVTITIETDLGAVKSSTKSVLMNVPDVSEWRFHKKSKRFAADPREEGWDPEHWEGTDGDSYPELTYLIQKKAEEAKRDVLYALYGKF